MTVSTLTRGEMERHLSQSVQAFYRNKLGCRTEKVSSHLLKEQVAIAIKNPITPLETLLYSSSDKQFVQDLRDRVDAIIKEDLVLTIEEILDVKVVAMTIDTTVDNSLTGIVALLSQQPETREPKRIPNRSKVGKSV